jgi:hypothetical protein
MYPFQSTYIIAANNPIALIDFMGRGVGGDKGKRKRTAEITPSSNAGGRDVFLETHSIITNSKGEIVSIENKSAYAGFSINGEIKDSPNIPTAVVIGVRKKLKPVGIVATGQSVVTVPNKGRKSVPISRTGNKIDFVCDFDIDADGAFKAYNQNNKIALDYLANGGEPGNWRALVTDNGKKTGNPIVQGSNNPAPGYYISATTYENPGFLRTDPRRYVDASSIPYIVVPNGKSLFRKKFGNQLGALARVTNLRNGKTAFAVVADLGPRTKLGEGSIYLAYLLGLNGSPKGGGTEAYQIKYEILLNVKIKGIITNEKIQKLCNDNF